MKLGEPSLDQLRLFLAVVDNGSFGGAARSMGRAVSAVSYGIAQMEALLDVSLFAREGSRRPVLTEAGMGLLAEARAVADAADTLMAKARSLHTGLESSLSLVVDVMVPSEATARVLRDFRVMFPTTALRLQVEALGAVAACLLDGEADLAIGGPVVIELPDLERQTIGAVELIPVASPSHPLAGSQVQPGESRRHLQLVLTDRSALSQGREFSVLSPQTWRLADLGAKHELLRQGIGWGNMPHHMVREDLASGALAPLDLPERPGATYPLNALWRRDTRLGPAASWLVDAFREALGGQGPPLDPKPAFGLAKHGPTTIQA
ncbi:MAG: LysR family transcriptional regulator [Sphingomonadaceae bacterium]